MGTDQLQSLAAQPELVSHLELFYSVTVKKIHCLDTDVYRLDHTSSKSGTEVSSWVIRVFPPSRPLTAVASDGQLLSFLAANNYPAETPVAPTAVTSYEGHGILVTHFIAGERPPRTKWTFYYLGKLLGQLTTLHTEDSGIIWAGGAWHHLCGCGDVSEEVRAAVAVMSATAAKQDFTVEENCALETVYAELNRLDGFGKLPKALVHPDIVPSNAILTADGQLRIVDWAGAGEGSRVVALGFLLWAAGVRELGLSAIAMAGYCMHATLEPEEIERLADAVYLRPLTMSCWSFSKGQKTLHELVQELRPMRELAESIATKAEAAFVKVKENP
ncbi:kinase-like domain-containing protein [Lipomyces starkeyi]|uniref:Aminoglycoside phosphotransferase domain-containing protein n=1 Tax=Lipomyces starkeyi NRRL Y-11557 TaxID=675824 RepID=A0A1E3Q048_LIPST|nr:hypothetical protein LIPSTDRAFT_146338 [Lipomyces starkeyi NRRL Y-11557]